MIARQAQAAEIGTRRRDASCALANVPTNPHPGSHSVTICPLIQRDLDHTANPIGQIFYCCVWVVVVCCVVVTGGGGGYVVVLVTLSDAAPLLLLYVVPVE
jgi:hypothetical protein